MMLRLVAIELQIEGTMLCCETPRVNTSEQIVCQSGCNQMQRRISWRTGTLRNTHQFPAGSQGCGTGIRAGFALLVGRINRFRILRFFRSAGTPCGCGRAVGAARKNASRLACASDRVHQPIRVA